jgi:quercetin dioxygenase-like cupin family protein
MNKVKCHRVYADSEGESQVEDVEVDLGERGATWLSTPTPVTEYHLLSWLPGRQTDWHAATRREVVFVLKGVLEVEASDGTRRRSTPGDIWFVDATSGRGYRTLVVGNDDFLAAVIVPNS